MLKLKLVSMLLESVHSVSTTEFNVSELHVHVSYPGHILCSIKKVKPSQDSMGGGGGGGGGGGERLVTCYTRSWSCSAVAYRPAPITNQL